MTIEQAIKKAKDYGFKQEGIDYFSFLLEPDFWKCLGKAMGWEVYRKPRKCKYYATPIGFENEWKTRWHSFIDHLADGKTPEQFFGKIKEN